eukprot:766651-Karenia_brevis.AAC.1
MKRASQFVGEKALADTAGASQIGLVAIDVASCLRDNPCRQRHRSPQWGRECHLLAAELMLEAMVRLQHSLEMPQ